MASGEEAGAEVGALVVGEAAGVGEDDEVGEVIGETAEGVGDPCAHAGKTWQGEAGVHHVAGGAVDAGFGGHGHEEGHAVDEFGLFGEDAADPATGLAVLLEGEGAFHDGAAIAGLAFGSDLWAEHLAVVFFECGFVVERVHGAGAAVHEELDDAFDLGGVMDAAVEFGRWRRAEGVEGEETGAGETGETAAGVPEEVAAAHGGVAV